MPDKKSITITHERIFTDEELHIVRMLADGKTRKEIAVYYEKSVRTIEARIWRLMKEFDCKQVTALVAFFFRKSLIK